MDLEFSAPEVSGPFGDRFAILHGSDSQRSVLTAQSEIVSHSGTTDIMLLGGETHQIEEFHVTRNYFRRQVRFALDEYDCLFNIVSDPDINGETLALMARILRSFKGRVINDPGAVALTTRDRISRRLAGIPGVVAPVTIKLPFANERAFRGAVERSALQFPAIVRLAGTHNGTVLGVYDDIDAMLPHLQRGRLHYLTSFVPYQDSDGLYRKCRFLFFGSDIVLRHLVISDHWNIHARDRARIMADRPELLEEEERVVAGGVEALSEPVRARLLAIRERVGLDFFGLDCSISEDGTIIFFEANAAMNFFPPAHGLQLKYSDIVYVRGRAAFRALVTGAIAEGAVLRV